MELFQDRHGEVLTHVASGRASSRPAIVGAALQVVELPIVRQRLMGAHVVAAARLVKLAAPCALQATSMIGAPRRAARQIQGVVAAEGVGMQVTVEVGEELLRAVAFAVDREIEDVVGMVRSPQ